MTTKKFTSFWRNLQEEVAENRELHAALMECQERIIDGLVAPLFDVDDAPGLEFVWSFDAEKQRWIFVESHPAVIENTVGQISIAYEKFNVPLSAALWTILDTGRYLRTFTYKRSSAEWMVSGLTTLSGDTRRHRYYSAICQLMLFATLNYGSDASARRPLPDKLDVAGLLYRTEEAMNYLCRLRMQFRETYGVSDHDADRNFLLWRARCKRKMM